MITRLDAEKALTTLIGTRESYRAVWTALMGDGAGNITDPDEPDFVLVRVHGLQNSVARVFNKAVPTTRPNLPVLIGTTRVHPTRVQVLSVDWEALPDWQGATLLPTHGADHELPDGSDPVYIQKRALVPLRASSQTTPNMTVYIAPDFYPWDDGFNYFEGGNSEDMTARVPGAGLHRFVMIYVDGASNALDYTNGETTPVTFPLGIEGIPEAPQGSVPICAVRLYYGMTAITEAELYDLRILVSPMGGSLAPANHALEPDAGPHTGRLDTQNLWASVACCGAQ